MQITIAGQAMAWYGAILSTVLAVITILRYLAERVRIRVSANQCYLTAGLGTQEEIILLKAVNIGKRPVTVVSGSLVLADGCQFMPTAPSYFGEPLPCKLEEGEVCTLWFSADVVRDGERENDTTVVAVRFEDAAGRKFQSRFHTRPTMREAER